MRPVSAGEMRTVLLMAAAVMVLTMLPYVAALHLAEPGEVFGGFIWGVDDGNVYLSWMRQASEGRLLLGNQYTTEPQNPHFCNLFLTLSGALCRVTGLPPICVFHGLRLLGGVAMLASFYWLVSLLTADYWTRWAALGLVSLGSGLGWVVVLLDGMGLNPGLRPVDVGVDWQVQPEAVTFVSLLLNPLFVVSMALICLTLGHALIALERRRLRSAALAGVLLLLLGNIHSYDIFAIHATLGLWIIYGLVTRRYAIGQAALSYAAILLVSIPAPLWSWWAAKQDPAYMAKAMTPTLSAGAGNYAVSYGLLALFAVVGLLQVRSGRHGKRPVGSDDAASARVHFPTSDGRWVDGAEAGRGHLLMFAVLWAVANSAVLALPVSFQRKLVEGLHMPVAILAGAGVAYLAQLLTRRAVAAGKFQVARERMALVVVAAVVLSIPSNALLVSQCLEHVRSNNETLLHVLAPPVYLSADYTGALHWLGEQVLPGQVILSSSLFGSYIPSAAKGQVYAGHWAETLDFPRKLGHVRRFYSPQSRADERLAVLVAAGADYVVYGPYERMMGWLDGDMDGQPDAVDLIAATGGVLHEVYASGDVLIYRVGR